jgi:hypothetical protein
MRLTHLLAVVAVAGLGVTAGCVRRRAYEPPAASYTVEALDIDDGGAGPPVRVRGAAVAPTFFAVDSGAPLPLLGRVFQPGDYRPGPTAIIVLGHRLWQRRYGARPQVIGTPIRVNGRPTIVVGVMPPEFDVPPGTDAWVPRVGADTAAAVTSPRGPR